VLFFVRSIIVLLAFMPAMAKAACPTGAYHSPAGDFVVIAPPASDAGAQRYLFRDGRRGAIGDQAGHIVCNADAVLVDGTSWSRIALTATLTTFASDGAMLRGKLIEPTGKERQPLVVMVHGSERTSAVTISIYPYILAAQGITVFVYDKRGTGGSEGEYTQNFELLADDAVAALGAAQGMTAGRFTRSGYFGGSQGGWVAPLAATRSKADFVAVGFGLVASPIEEDREQMISEARAANYGDAVIADIDRLSRATDTLVSSHFARGYEQLDQLRHAFRDQPWAKSIRGEYSGDMLRSSDADLRRVGQARFDNLELIWHYDAAAALRKLNIPVLWVLAGEDREAPIETTQNVLTGLARSGKRIDRYLFPDTDHGMVEFTTLPDGSRKATRITDGYFRLLGDWIKGAANGAYGRGQRLR
jgi:pimeloyl-ACP methyl ester carboxylesterase